MLLRCSMCIPQMLTELIEMISNWSGFYHSIESLNAAAAATLHSDPEKVVEGTWRYTLTLANYTVHVTLSLHGVGCQPATERIFSLLDKLVVMTLSACF